MIKKIILFCFALLILFSCNDEKSNIASKEFGKEKLRSIFCFLLESWWDKNRNIIYS